MPNAQAYIHLGPRPSCIFRATPPLLSRVLAATDIAVQSWVDLQGRMKLISASQPKGIHLWRQVGQQRLGIQFRFLMFSGRNNSNSGISQLGKKEEREGGRERMRWGGDVV